MTDETIADCVEETAPSRTLSIGVALESLVFLLIGLYFLVRVVPAFVAVYDQIKIAPPLATLILIQCSKFMCTHLWIAGASVLALPFCLIRLGERDRKRLRSLLPLVFAFFVGWATYALFSPLIIILEFIGPKRH